MNNDEIKCEEVLLQQLKKQEKQEAAPEQNSASKNTQEPITSQNEPFDPESAPINIPTISHRVEENSVDEAKSEEDFGRLETLLEHELIALNHMKIEMNNYKKNHLRKVNQTFKTLAKTCQKKLNFR